MFVAALNGTYDTYFRKSIEFEYLEFVSDHDLVSLLNENSNSEKYSIFPEGMVINLSGDEKVLNGTTGVNISVLRNANLVIAQTTTGL